jgi:hypothetical protein
VADADETWSAWRPRRYRILKEARGLSVATAAEAEPRRGGAEPLIVRVIDLMQPDRRRGITWSVSWTSIRGTSCITRFWNGRPDGESGGPGGDRRCQVLTASRSNDRCSVDNGAATSRGILLVLKENGLQHRIKPHCPEEWHDGQPTGPCERLRQKSCGPAARRKCWQRSSGGTTRNGRTRGLLLPVVYYRLTATKKGGENWRRPGIEGRKEPGVEAENHPFAEGQPAHN